MKITYAQLTLARGEAYNEEPVGLRVESAHEVQELRYLRASQQSAANRGNLRSRVSFSVTRRHASEADALRFSLTHPAQFPIGSGQPLRIDAENHRKRTSFTLQQAVPVDIRSSASGPITATAYEFLGGATLTDTQS